MEGQNRYGGGSYSSRGSNLWACFLCIHDDVLVKGGLRWMVWRLCESRSGVAVRGGDVVVVVVRMETGNEFV